MGLTRLLACEWAPHSINVNAIAPGDMATRNTQPIQDDPARSKQRLERIPAGRWGKPEDLKGAVIFLVSEAARYIAAIRWPWMAGGWPAEHAINETAQQEKAALLIGCHRKGGQAYANHLL